LFLVVWSSRRILSSTTNKLGEKIFKTIAQICQLFYKEHDLLSYKSLLVFDISTEIEDEQHEENILFQKLFHAADKQITNEPIFNILSIKEAAVWLMYRRRLQCKI